MRRILALGVAALAVLAGLQGGMQEAMDHLEQVAVSLR
jgi:hypothetical protein